MRRLVALMCVLVMLTAPIEAQPPIEDNFGTEFFVTFLPNIRELGLVPAQQVQLTAPVATTVTVEYPVTAPVFVQAVAVTPGDVTIVDLPVEVESNWTHGVVANNVVRLSAPDEFAVYTNNRVQFSSDAALALPVDVLNQEYIVMDYTPTAAAQFNVFAPFDNTTVTITPAAALRGGEPAGVPFQVTLNRGEGVLYQSADPVVPPPGASLTGTIIQADRPVGVTNGNFCAEVPTGTRRCDHLYEVAPPVQTWGDDVLAFNLSGRPGGTIYRVVAAEDGTTVTRNGAVIGTLNRGQFLETPPLTDGQRFQANNPIQVAQYITGSGSPGATTGDPSMGNMIPFAQYGNAYTFSTVGGAQFATNFVTIITANADVGTLTLDGAAIPAAQFAPLSAGFSVTIQPITSGVHTTASTNPHGITVQGYNQDDSYLYPGGARFEVINQVDDLLPPLVDVTIPACPAVEPVTGTATDNRTDDSGIFAVTLDATAVNLVLTPTAFTPGDPVVTFSVSRADPSIPGGGNVLVRDGSGNTTATTISIDDAVCTPPTATPPPTAILTLTSTPPVTLTPPPGEPTMVTPAGPTSTPARDDANLTGADAPPRPPGDLLSVAELDALRLPATGESPWWRDWLLLVAGGVLVTLVGVFLRR